MSLLIFISLNVFTNSLKKKNFKWHNCCSTVCEFITNKRSNIMKLVWKIFATLSVIFLFSFFSNAKLFAQHGRSNRAAYNLIGANRNGGNNYAIDSDSDGIINCLDPDFVRPMDGSGRKLMNGNTNKSALGKNISASRKNNQNTLSSSAGNRSFLGTNAGICDGTGPKGKIQRGGRK